MGLGDVADTTVPKICLVAPPRRGGTVATRMFIPHRVHTSIGVLGAVTVATAAVHRGQRRPPPAVHGRAAATSCGSSTPPAASTWWSTSAPGRTASRLDGRRSSRTARLLLDGTVYPSTRD